MSLTRAAFPTVGIPRENYVERPYYARKITGLFNREGPGIGALFGASQTGKTVLYLHELEHTPGKHVRMHGRNIKSLDDFWNTIYDSLDLPEYSQRKHVQIGASIGGTGIEYEDDRERTYKSGIRDIERILRKEQIIIVIDDFHFVPSDVRTEIINTVKALIDKTESSGSKGIKVLFVYIATMEMRRAGLWREMAIRITSIGLPLWQFPELMQIGAKRFIESGNAVNGLRVFAEESYGLPSLMQAYCGEYCEQAMGGKLPNGQIIAIADKFLLRVMRTVGNTLWQQGNAEILQNMISKEANLYTDVIPRKTHGGGNINHMIWHALSASKLPVFQIEVDAMSIKVSLATLMERLEKIASIESVKGKIPDSLQFMYDTMIYSFEEEIRGNSRSLDPVMEYSQKERVLYINSPAFLVALRHAKPHEELFG